MAYKSVFYGLTFLFAVVSVILPTHEKETKLVCYYTHWASQRMQPGGRMFVHDIDPFLCTHLILAFAKIDAQRFRLVPSDYHDLDRDNTFGKYTKFNRLKIRNPRLKTMISIGGANEISDTFATISASIYSRTTFARHAAQFLRAHRFDGLDIDWEYPYNATKTTFTLLLQALMSQFKIESAQNGLGRLQLSIAASAGRDQIDESYEVANISKTVDFINLMAYDFSGPWSKLAGLNAPLYPRKGDPRFNQDLCQEWAVNYWIKQGADRKKIILGIPANGRSFTLQNISYDAIGDKVIGAGRQGNLLMIPGVLGYYEVCQFLNQSHVKIVWDSIQEAPYAFRGLEWVTYDNRRSVEIKTQWMLSQSLGGVMVWTIDFDDFNGKFCKDGKFPLTSSIKNTIDSAATELPTNVTSSNKNRITRPTYPDPPQYKYNSTATILSASLTMTLFILTDLLY